MKKAALFSLIVIATLALQPAALPVAAQDPAPNPGTPLQSLDTKLEATETFDPQANLNRVHLDFRAALLLGQNGLIDPLSDHLLVELIQSAGIVMPTDSVAIPGGCFSQNTNGFWVRDPQGCGVSIRLEFPPESNQQPIDLTPGLIDFDARLTPAGGGEWNLRIDASFFASPQSPTPCYLTILGGADKTIVQIGDDIGRTAPRRLEVIGSSQ